MTSPRRPSPVELVAGFVRGARRRRRCPAGSAIPAASGPTSPASKLIGAEEVPTRPTWRPRRPPRAQAPARRGAGRRGPGPDAHGGRERHLAAVRSGGSRSSWSPPRSWLTTWGSSGPSTASAVAHAAGRAGQVDDQRAAGGARPGRGRAPTSGTPFSAPYRRTASAMPGRLALEHRAGRLGGDVGGGEPGAAGGEDDVEAHVHRRAQHRRPARSTSSGSTCGPSTSNPSARSPSARACPLRSS